MEEEINISEDELAIPNVRLEESNKLFCFICTVFVKRVKTHIRSQTHKLYLKSFHSEFVHEGKKAYCKTCSCKIKWNAIRNHGEMHKLAPWYKGVPSRPDSKMNFDNHTFKYGSTYYCFLCKKVLTWDTSVSHFQECDHQNRKQKFGKTVDFNKKQYTLFVKQGFFLGMDMTIGCIFCKIGFKDSDTKGHAQTTQHIQNRKKFITDIRKLKEMQSFENKDSESDFENASQSSSKLIKADCYRNDDIPFRSICSQNMIRHFSPKRSSEGAVEEKKQYPQKLGNVFKLKTVAKAKRSLKTPCRLSEPLHHDIPISFVVNSNSDFSMAAIASNDKQRKRSIVKFNEEKLDPYCVICYAEIPGNLAIEDHLNGKRHDAARKKYGCDNILPMEGNNYCCTICDCTVSGFDNVYHHITSTSHLRSICKAQEDNQENRRTLDELENSTEVEKASKHSDQSRPCLYVVKQNAKKSFCQICNDTQFPVATKNINDHITGQRHKIALVRYGCGNIILKACGTYYCGCCHCELSSLENVYIHIKEKKHMSSLIKVCNKQEGQSGRGEVEYPTLSEDFDVSCQDLYSSYIKKQMKKSFPCKPVQNCMISTFTVEPNNANCRTIPDNSIARQKPKSLTLKKVRGQAKARNVLEGMYLMPSENRLSYITTKPNAAEIAGQRRGAMNTTLQFETLVKKVNCTVCRTSVENRTKLHVHMARHYTEEFVQFKRNRNNGMMNGCLTDDQMAKEGNSNGAAQQAPKSLSGQQELLIGGEITNGVDNGPVNISDGLLDSYTGTINPETTNIGTEDDEVVRNVQTLKNNMTSYRKKRSQKIVNMRKATKHLNFDHDYIYDLIDKLADVELGLKLGLVLDSSKIYCLVCRVAVDYTLDNYTEHLNSIEHCNYLEEMETDNALFADYSNQFSDLDLAQEYMQEISEDTVHCIICDEKIRNIGHSLEAHIYHEVHERKCEQTRAIAKKYFEEIKPQMHCDWYGVQKYWCVTCETNTESEVNFIKHLKSNQHVTFMKRPENVGKRMIFDFCAPCALLLYGYRCTYFYHSQIDSHKWLKDDGHYNLTELPRHAKDLVASPEQFIHDKIKYFKEVHDVERVREKQLIRDLEKAVKMRFPLARAYLFGSRVSGLGSPDSDIDIFLDCRKVYDGNASTEDRIMFFITGVVQCFMKDPQSWDVEELLTNCRSPIIRAFHRVTGLPCDISFENGLAVENTKLIKAYNRIFPTCREITLFLKQWLLHCDLSGSDKITNYALYWYVIFYLQMESILPSVASLIAMKKSSHVIAGWEVGVTHDFNCNEELCNFSIKEFLTRFFLFYVNFDFRYDVACPLLGEVVPKRAFVDPRNLPEKMERYVAYMRRPGGPEPFRIDSPMCIQDPFDLQHNLTKAVSKAYLNRFRKCCAKSLDLLWSS